MNEITRALVIVGAVASALAVTALRAAYGIGRLGVRLTLGRFGPAGIDKVPVVVVIDGRGAPIGVDQGHMTVHRIGWALRGAGVHGCVKSLFWPSTPSKFKP
ncbi:MAG: hypothetical protein OEM84_08965 [Acidimicrobiia bacterium]|nr:hypothetical protein [Acidimicrobiia bacterium]